MSNIPEAKRILSEAIEGDSAYDSGSMYSAIVHALVLMDRKKPSFVAKARVPKLSWRQKQKVRQLRETGMSLHDIAVRMGTNIGRVSEAVNALSDQGS